MERYSLQYQDSKNIKKFVKVAEAKSMRALWIPQIKNLCISA